MYNKALIIYTDARTSDSLAFIKDEQKRWDEHQIPDDTDRKLRSFFESKYMIEIAMLIKFIFSLSLQISNVYIYQI